MKIRNRVTDLLGVDVPIVQAPMGWIARAQLASAVSNAGAMGIIETSSGRLEEIRDEIRKMRDLTDKPFGVNIAQAFVRDPASSISWSSRASSSSPPRPAIRPSTAPVSSRPVSPSSMWCRRCAARSKAIDAGVDGLVVEGGEGGGFKNPRDVATMVLLPLVRSKVSVPIIAAGGITRRALDGGGVRAGRRGRADGHPHGVVRRVARARQLEERDPRRAGDRHRVPQPLLDARAARAAHRAHDPARAPGARRHGRVRPRRRPLLRRRHGGVDRALWSGGRPHRRGEAGGADHRRDHARVLRGGGRPGRSLRRQRPR